MTPSKQDTQSGIQFELVLFLIFLTLKLTRVIDWSWWFVFAPLWLPMALLFIVFTVALIVAAVSGKGDR